MDSGVWLVNGLPGSGKTTVARALAATLPRSAHIEGDRLSYMVIGGRAFPPRPHSSDEDELTQLDLSYNHQAQLAASFHAEGFTPIIDFFIYNALDLPKYWQMLKPLPLYFVTLNPSRQAILARDAGRGKKHAATWLPFREGMLTELQNVGLVVDNTDLNVAETVTSIVENQARAQVQDLSV